MPTYDELKKLNDQNFSDSPVASAQALSVNKVPEINLKGVESRDYGQSSLFREISQDAVYTNQNKSVASPFASDYFNTKIWGLDLGAVTDRQKNIYGGVNPYSKAVDFEDLRRNEQSNFTAGLNTFNQFLGKTVINTAGGIIGGFYSLGAAAINQDSSLLFDNSVNRTLDKGTDWVEKNNSVFTSQRGRDNAPLGFFSFETVKDFSDAYSFITGAVASELIIDAGTAGVGLVGLPGRIAKGASLIDKTMHKAAKAVGLGNGVRTSGSFITRSEELGRLLSSVDPTDINRLQQIARETGSNVQDLQRYRKSLDTFNSTIQKGRQLVTGTFWEAGLEARHTKDDLVNSQITKLEDFLNSNKDMSDEEKENYRISETQRINDMANTAGIWTFGLNTAVLGASNYIQFPTIFGSRTLSSADNLSGRLTRRGITDYVKNGGKLTDIAKTVGKALKSPITEFTEETLQGAINIGSKSYYESMMGTRTSNGEILPAVSNVSDSVLKGLKDTYGTKEGLHEGIIGAMVGAVGLPMLRKNKSGKLRPYMTGGIFESVRELQEDNNNINQAIQDLNLNEFDTLLSYNKDNAILASLDAKKEGVANYNDDKFEIDRLNDNKVFRHVRDRLDKGLESYMNEDVNELKQLSLEEYKQRFNKDDNFTEANKNSEINDFANKVDIYSDAYKKVFEGLEMGRINNSPVSKKLFDTLTYAVANEKIYKQRQKELTDELLSNPNIDLNYQELIKLAELSDRFRNHENDIDSYIKSREDNKLETFEKKKAKVTDKINSIKSKVDSKYQDIFDNVLDNDSDTINYLTSLISLQKELESNTYKDLIANSEEIFANTEQLNSLIEEVKLIESKREKETKFNADKSPTVRNLNKQSIPLIEKIKQDLEKSSSKSLEILRNKKETATQKELDDYISLRTKAQEAIKNSNSNNQNSFLDTLDNNNQNIEETLNELANITKHQILALDIANNLYGFNNKAYGKIIQAEFEENLANLRDDSQLALMELLRQDDQDYMAELVANMNISISNLKENLIEYQDNLNEELITYIEDSITKAEDIRDTLMKYLDIQDEKEEIAITTKQEDSFGLDQALIDEIKRGLAEEENNKKETDENSEGKIENSEFDNTKVTFLNTKNLHTIAPINNSNANSIKSKIDDGTIKYNSGAIASYIEDNESTMEFMNYIVANTDEYKRGKDKVIANPELLKQDITDMDEDVKTFIIHAPVNVNIYNKEVEVTEGEQEFEVDKDTTVAHNFLYFAPIISDENLNDNVLFTFRQALLYNNYNNASNELKMRLGNIINGYIEKVGDITDNVEEFAIANDSEGNNLIEDINQIQAEDILFGNQSGEYKTFSGNKTTAKLNRGSLIEKSNAINGRIYLRYRTINNQEIPVILNRAKIKTNEVIFDEIVYQIEEYFKEDKKPNSSIKLKNENLSILKNITYEQFFRTFFDENNSGSSYAGLETLNIIKENNNLILGNLNLEIDTVDTFNLNKDFILNSIGEMRFYINKQSFRNKDDSFNREFLEFAINNKLINHAFNSKENSDKIFLKNNKDDKPFNKAIQFHLLNSTVREINNKPKLKIKDLTNILNELLGSQDNKNLSWKNVFYNINAAIIAKAKELVVNNSAEQSIKESFNTVLTDKINKAKALITLFPNQYTDNLEESLINNSNIKILSSDKIIDKYFKVVYDYKNKYGSNRSLLLGLTKFLNNKNDQGLTKSLEQDITSNYESNKLLQGNIDLDNINIQVEKPVETLDDAANRLINSVNIPEPSIDNAIPNKAFEDSYQDDVEPGSLAEELSFLLNPDKLDNMLLIDNSNSSDIEVDINPLTRQEKEYIKGSKKLLIESFNDISNAKDFNTEDISEFLKEYNINTYKKLVEALNIVYSDNSKKLNEMITFAKTIYKDNQETEIFNCK